MSFFLYMIDIEGKVHFISPHFYVLKEVAGSLIFINYLMGSFILQKKRQTLIKHGLTFFCFLKNQLDLSL